MKKWLKITIGVVIVVILMIISFYVGGTLGFVTGFSYHNALEAGVNGVLTVSVLESLRAGRVEDAVDLLETQLDTYIIEHSYLGENRRAPFDIFFINQHDANFMSRVAKYRKKHLTDKYLEPFIAEILMQYEEKNAQ